MRQGIFKRGCRCKGDEEGRAQAWCCGSGGGVKSAFDDFALWSAAERIKEAREAGAESLVSACPFCKRNLMEASEKEGKGMKVYDIVELVNLGLEERIL